MDNGYLLGFDIGGTKTAVVLGDSNGVAKKIRFTTESCEKTLDMIMEVVSKLGKAESIGISCGGPLDSKKGLILSPPNLVGWDNVPIVHMLQERFGIPAYLCNDADACALAEWKFGAGKGCENMIFLTFGTGMGAGLILNGKLYSGSRGMAGEVGHMRMSRFGPVGYGKSGSFEGFCSGGGLAGIGQTLAREKLQMGVKLPYCECISDIEKINAKVLADFARGGDEVALEAYRICGEKLGEGLAILCDILDPEVIVIGSVFARAEELLRPHMEKVLEREALMGCNGCKVIPAALGESIGDFAALAVAEGI